MNTAARKPIVALDTAAAVVCNKKCRLRTHLQEFSLFAVDMRRLFLYKETPSEDIRHLARCREAIRIMNNTHNKTGYWWWRFRSMRSR